MSGNIGEKARATFLALIMVTSVMAAGVAFTGSAAALEDPSNEGEYGDLAVIGSTANGDEASATGTDLRATVIVDSDSNLIGEQLQTINITSSDLADATTPSDYSDGNLQLTVISPDGSQSSISVATPAENGAGTDTSDANNLIGLQGIEDSGTGGSASGITLNEGDIIRLELQGENVDLNSVSGDLEATVQVGTVDDTDTTSQDTSETVDVTAELPGPVTLADSSNAYSTLSQALTDGEIDDEANTITVGDGLYDEATNQLSLTNDDVTIEAAGGANPKVITQSQPIFTSTGKNVTVDGLTIEGKYDSGITDHLVQFEDNNATFQNNVFNVSIADGGDEHGFAFIALQGSSPADSEILNNEFRDKYTDGGTQNGLYTVQAGGEADRSLIEGNTIEAMSGIYVASENLTVRSNQINVTAGAVYTSDSGSNTLDNLLIDNNDIVKTTTYGGSTNYAIRLSDGEGMVVQENRIDGQSNDFAEGILINSQSASSNGLGNVTINSSNEIHNASTAVDIVDAGAFANSDVTIDISDLNVDLGDASGSPTGININVDSGTLPDVEVSSSSINATDTGIHAQSAGDYVNVTDTSVDNSGSDAINLDNAGADVNADGVSIDQASSTGVVVNVQSTNSIDITNADINGTSSGVDITNVNDADDTYVNVTDSIFTNNDGAGLNYSATTSVTTNDPGLNVHFNTFENNDVGIGFDDEDSSNYQSTFNAIFNDFVDNDVAGLDVVEIDSDDGGVVNTNYSWWDNRDYSRIVGPYTLQNAESQLLSPRRVYSYTRLHTGGQP